MTREEFLNLVTELEDAVAYLEFCNENGPGYSTYESLEVAVTEARDALMAAYDTLTSK